MWKRELGERVLLLEDSNNVAELIGLTIGLCEGTVDIDAGSHDLASIGADSATITAVRAALVPLASTGVPTKMGTVSNLPEVPGASGGVTQL